MNEITPLTPEKVEAIRLSLEADHAKGLPGVVDGETALAVIAAHQRLMSDTLALSDKLDAPCGSCHPCNNYADETWKAAGRTPPHVYAWDEAQAEIKQLREQRDRLLALHEYDELIFGGFYCVHCTPDDADDPDDNVYWPCPSLLAVGVDNDEGNAIICARRDAIARKAAQEAGTR